MWPVSKQVAGKFLDLLYGRREGYAEIRVLNDASTRQSWFAWPDAREVLLDDVDKRSLDNVFMGALLRTKSGKGDAAHTEQLTEWLWADVDRKRGSTFGSLLSKISHYPQIIVDSGHGWHLYWHLNKPVPVDVAQGAMSVLAERLDGDKVGDPARVMRLPGSLNNKDDDAIPVRLLRYDPVFTHRFSDFDVPEFVDEKYDGTYEGDGWQLSSPDAPKFGEGERNTGLTRLAGAMMFKGLDKDDMLDALTAENELRCDPPLRHSEVEAIVKSVWRYR